MSTTTINYPNVIHVQRSLTIQLIKILIIISLALITSAILVKVSSAPSDSFQADLVPVVQNSITPISVPVPTPPIAYITPILSKTPAPASMVANEPSAIPVPVPTPPSL
jgi:hypothetical protein